MIVEQDNRGFNDKTDHPPLGWGKKSLLLPKWGSGQVAPLDCLIPK